MALRIAYFISPHGYGHAARAAAMMSELIRLEPEAHFDIYTLVPEWFFTDSLPAFHLTYHPLETDIGLIQPGPLTEDLPATIARLSAFIPFDPAQVARLAEEIIQAQCRLVLCDISQLGIAVAKVARLPSVLIENFTWDWIYAGYLSEAPDFAEPIRLMAGWFAQADYHIQTTPACRRDPDADLQTAPVARSPRLSRKEIRASLEIPESAPVVLITLGGISKTIHVPDRSEVVEDTWFIIPGGSLTSETRDHLILLPHHSGYYHPDLVAASDAIVGKAGYSTLAETYQAGIPFVYLARPRFPETRVMGEFISKEMGGFEISTTDYLEGTFYQRLQDLMLMRRDRSSQVKQNGALQAAAFIHTLAQA